MRTADGRQLIGSSVDNDLGIRDWQRGDEPNHSREIGEDTKPGLGRLRLCRT